MNLVKQFYIEDYIRRQAPGRKDVKTVLNENGFKDRLQTRHLQHLIKEAYALFVKQYPEIKIGKSKFAEMQLKYVLLSSKLPHNVCRCKYHKNFMMAFESLHNEIPHIPKYSEIFLRCWYVILIQKTVGLTNVLDVKRVRFSWTCTQNVFKILEITITWFVWKKCEDRLCKVVEGLTKDLMKYICDLIPEFLEH